MQSQVDSHMPTRVSFVIGGEMQLLVQSMWQLGINRVREHDLELKLSLNFKLVQRKQGSCVPSTILPCCCSNCVPFSIIAAIACIHGVRG